MADDAYDAKRVRKRIDEIIKRRGLKRRPAAESAGVAEGALRKFLAGESGSMTLESVVRLAAALGVTVSELIGDELPPPPRAA